MADINEIEKLKGDKPIPTLTLIKRTFSYFKGEMGFFLLAMLLMGLNVAFDLIYPQLIQNEINYLDNGAIGATSFNVVLGIALGYLGIAIAGQVCMYLESILLLRSGQRII